ncbi:MAG: AAA family ATPase [Candidatus Symbiothrix sp.]|jgi:predicted AAA+ superfamily ATPase|nr:AAA family ATPase [Candidatus Symbiothrix sp.]
MFRRNVLEKLSVWAEKENRKPLVLRGSRQVGKTSIINMFAENFDTYLYLNLEDKRAKVLFDTDKAIDDLLTAIYLYCNKPRLQNRTLLFIDEIQNSPAAVARLRYFYEQKPDLYVIAAGSLLESLIDMHISFPVGRVEYLAIHPCCFDEFLVAIGETELSKAVKNCNVPDVLHEKTMDLFNTFTLIGGMPEIVAHYAKNKDLVTLNDIFETLLTGYKDDVEKYARNETMKNVIRYVLQEGWSFAAQRISLGSFAGSSYKAREVGEAFRTLEKTMLLELVYPTVNTVIPLTAELKRSPKLIWLDAGIVNYVADIQKEIFGAKDILDVWRGDIAEQIVAQELIANNHNVSTKRKYWVREKKGSDAEIDFLVQKDGKIYPVEVKSGVNAKLKSLQIFMENSTAKTAVRVWSGNFSIDEITLPDGKTYELYNIPFYYVAHLKQIVP